MQGVGFRYFVQRSAAELGIAGYTRNLDDGSVEVYAIGNAESLSTLEGLLWKGPRFAEVRGVEGAGAELLNYRSFLIEPE